jgi:tetratricopeptide (TPR) repeat protein
MTTVRMAMQAGQYLAANEAIDRIEAQHYTDEEAMLGIGECRTHLGQHMLAERACRAALKAAPNSTRAAYALASVLVATGDIDEADTLYSRVIDQSPRDWDAWINRSTLRTATPERNHVSAIQRALREAGSNPDAAVALGYALAKEFEDLGEFDAAFIHLADAAQIRRSRMAYRVDADVRTMAAIADAFCLKRLAKTPLATDEEGPIFVLGLPRSGTTLVDRILASHADITSFGELQDFPLALMQTNSDVSDKASLINKSAQMDHTTLGSEYLRRINGLSTTPGFVIDKAPLNFLYIGLIALALPNARIVHVRRGAMDSSYAMFKSLFRMGYPFSYSLADLAEYRIGYADLMAHWRHALPNRMVEIDYELLVRNPESETRRMLNELRIGWDESCLNPQRNISPVATASAVQVRAPIHDRSVGLWRKYEQHLAPLIAAFTAADIPLETGGTGCFAS